MANDSKFLILDGHSLAYRAFHALPPENFVTSAGQHTNAVYGFLSMMINVVKEQQPTHVAVAFDLSRETFRTKEYPEYKATRSASPPEFKGQVELVKQLLEALNIPVVTVPNYEADDILATLAHHSSIPVRILTGDRDSFQLISDDTLILYPRKSINDLAHMDDAAVQEKYGVPANRYRDLAALVGETSDNLPGIPGVGPKTAAKWIMQFGGVEEILANREAISGKVGEALREHVADVERNYRLNKLVDNLEISTNLDDYVHRSYDTSKVHELLDALEFNQLRPRLLAVWPSADGQVPAIESAEADIAESFVVEAIQLDSVGLKKWLAAQSKPVAIAFAGSWGRGTGTISLVAFAAQNGDVRWSRFHDVQDSLGEWLASDSPKIVHDVKGALTALLVNGLTINNIAIDTAIAAYLVAPGTRNFELPDLVQRYLKKNLDSSSEAQSAQTLFDEAEETGDALAVHARAMLDLADHFAADLANRGAAELMRDIEIPLIEILARMEVAGIAVDEKALKGLEDSFEADAQAAVKQAHNAAGHEFNLGSPKQLQEVLFEERGLPKTKKIKTGYTTDAEALQGLLEKMPDDELLIALLRYREVSKLRQTVTGLLSCVADDGRVHTTFNQMIAATGRLSSTDPNLQNIPIRTAEGARIRETFVVGKGYETLLTADYSQIELRVMAHLSGDAGLIAALESGEDLHTTVGSQIFGVEPSQVTPDMRRQVKAMSYGLAYGLSAFGLAAQLGISNGAAKDLMETYFERFGGVRDYLKNVVVEARKTGYTESMLGRRRYLPDLNSEQRQLRDMAERMALNAPIQGSAADIVKLAMLKVDKAFTEAGVKSRLLLQVHDELVVEVAKGEIDQVTAILTNEMQNALEMSVPLDVSVGVGKSWSEAAH